MLNKFELLLLLCCGDCELGASEAFVDGGEFVDRNRFVILLTVDVVSAAAAAADDRLFESVSEIVRLR